jgi:hypothetical protein
VSFYAAPEASSETVRDCRSKEKIDNESYYSQSVSDWHLPHVNVNVEIQNVIWGRSIKLIHARKESQTTKVGVSQGVIERTSRILSIRIDLMRFARDGWSWRKAVLVLDNPLVRCLHIQSDRWNRD